MAMKRRDFVKAGVAIGGAIVPLQSILARRAFGLTPQGAPLPGNMIPQFVDPLPDLTSGIKVLTGTDLVLKMKEFESQVLPTGMPMTWVWGYRVDGQAPTDSYINPVVIATRNTATQIKFVNQLGSADPVNLGVGSKIGAWVQSTDQTLHWADPKGDMMNHPMTNYAGPIPAVPHLHGGEVPPQLDGGPDAWFTSDGNYVGHAYYSRDNINKKSHCIYNYPNTQEGANIWFHDHALGITRLNVYAGLAGAYIINEPGLWMPSSAKPDLIPLVIQDRMFDVNGQLFFPNVGINPEHPFWIPEFVGDTIVVNGKVWPHKAVDRKRYTLFFLNGSNARFYDMFLIDPVSGVMGPPMYVITTDGGSLDKPVRVDPNASGREVKAGVSKSIVVGPGERYEAIVDFNDATWLANITAAYAALGQPVPNPIRLHLRNNARTPFPGGAPAQNSTTGRVMEFRVSATVPGDSSFDPSALAVLRSRAVVRLFDKATLNAATGLPTKTWSVRRQLTLNEAMGPGGPLEVLVNNTKWDGKSVHKNATSNSVVFDASGVRSDFPFVNNGNYYSELPDEGKTELWEIINITADAHPIHLHLVQFQLVSRQQFDTARYNAAYDALFPASSAIDPMTGAPYAGGVFIGAYGPPLHYTDGNTVALGGNPDVTSFLNARKWPARPPLPHEEGWKDTVIMYPGEVTRILVRWAPTDLATNASAAALHFPFDPNGGHGFVWHCHIIDHEDNEMMRPDRVELNPLAPVPSARLLKKGTDY